MINPLRLPNDHIILLIIVKMLMAYVLPQFLRAEIGSIIKAFKSGLFLIVAFTVPEVLL